MTKSWNYTNDIWSRYKLLLRTRRCWTAYWVTTRTTFRRQAGTKMAIVV